MQGEIEHPFTPLSPLPGVQWTIPVVVETLSSLELEVVDSKVEIKLVAIANFDKEVVEPTAEDIAELQADPLTLQFLSADKPSKLKRRRKDSPRKRIPVDLKKINHTICGPRCKEIPVPESVVSLNKEFAKLFPETLPQGLPQSRVTDHRIYLKPNSKVPAQRIYRLAPQQDEELQKQLKELLEAGLIEPATSEYGSGILFVTKANGKLRMCVDYRPLNDITVVDQYP